MVDSDFMEAALSYPNTVSSVLLETCDLGKFVKNGKELRTKYVQSE